MCSVPIDGRSGVKGSPALICTDPRCTPPGGRLGPSGYTGAPPLGAKSAGSENIIIPMHPNL